MVIKRLALWLILSLTTFLNGCMASARLLNFPFDPGGRSLNSPFSEQSPRISGRYLVFSSDRQGTQGIFLYDTVEQRLLELPGLNSLDLLASSPAISQDGRWIVFAGTRQERTGIYLYNRETRQLRNLTENLRAEVRNPTINADGSVIAFESSANGQWDILVYDRLGQPLNVPMNPQ